MPWNAVTDRDAVEPGTIVHVDRGYSDVPPQPDDEIHIVNPASGHATTARVVSSSGDRLELHTGDSIVTLTLSEGRRPNVLDAEGRYYESWVVL